MHRRTPRNLGLNILVDALWRYDGFRKLSVTTFGVYFHDDLTT
jgi:hypothetical protein